MNAEYYPVIFKRKSFHLFRNVGNNKLTEFELEKIRKAFDSFERLYPDIKTAIRIIPAEKVNFKRDAEYCILIYSEKKTNYLMNAGYLGEQLDLYLVKNNIGSLWFGIGKANEQTFEGLEFVIMIAIRKITDETLFRKDMFKSKRKPTEEIWDGDTLGIAEIVRFAPSACNTQPWFVQMKNSLLVVNRYKKAGKRGIMPAKLVDYFNRIDIGIFLCFLEICLSEKGITCARTLYPDNLEESKEYTKVAEYTILSKNNESKIDKGVNENG